MSKISSYVRQTIAMFKGDTDKVLAENNYRVVLNGIKIQTALLEGEKFKKEESVAQAEQELQSAKFPTEKVTNTDRYFERVNSAQNNLEEAKEALETIKESIIKYEKLKDEFSAEVTESKEESK
jgi:hypothetical protein